MAGLALSDLSLIEGSWRLTDLRLAEALGYSDPHKVRGLIARNMRSIASYGPVVSLISTYGALGRPGKAYLLTVAQAMRVCMICRSDRSGEVADRLARMVEGPGATAQARRDIALMHGAVDGRSRRQRTSSKGAWWYDREQRAWIIEHHRRLKITDAVAAFNARFGADTISRSAMGRAFQCIDHVKEAA